MSPYNSDVSVQWKQLKVDGAVWCSCRADCRTHRPHLRVWRGSGAGTSLSYVVPMCPVITCLYSPCTCEM